MKIHKVLALPESPEEDAIYYVKNGAFADLYIVSNEGVATQVSSGRDPLTVSDTAPTDPSDGHLWFDSSKGILYTYYADGDSTQWVSAHNSAFNEALTASQEAVLSHLSYDAVSEKIIADRAIETTLNSLFLGEQHKMTSGAENIFFKNLGSDISYFPMWAGLRDQSVVANQDSTGYISPSARTYGDMVSTALGGNPASGTSAGYSDTTTFPASAAGLGVTTVIAENIPTTTELEYTVSIGGRTVYSQQISFNTLQTSGSSIEWFFEHPVEVHAGTTVFAEIRKKNKVTKEDLGVLQVVQGDDGTGRYYSVVHNRLFEDKDLELISPYSKYQAMDFGVDTTGSSIFLRDLSLGSESALVAHGINTIEAVANGATIQVKLKDGQKILVESLPVTGATIDGNPVNSVLNQAVTELNNLFSSGYSFSSQGNPVTGFSLAGNNLTLTLEDSTSYVVDVTSLGVDENKFVQSGALSGTDLVLTMNDASTVTIDATNMVNGSQLLAPTVSNQSFDVTEGQSLNAQLVATDYIVNQWVETDAPSWVSLNQNTGVLSGTAPAFAGTSADTILINCKAANVLGGAVSFQVTLNVEEITYTNTKSLKFVNGVNSYLGGNASQITSLERSGSGSGASDAWTLSMWIKDTLGNNPGQTLFYFGSNDITNGGHIEVRQINTSGNKRIRLRYGSNNNMIQIQSPSNSTSYPTNQWNHVMLTYDGGTTGASSGSISSYYGRFKMFINGAQVTTANSHSNFGWSSGITGTNYRFGRYLSGNYPQGVLFNQMAIWDSDQSSNISGIYNGGATQDLTDLNTVSGSMNASYLAPAHYYEIETSVTAISDINGSTPLVGYNFASGDLVNDAP